ncbi:MAG: AAA family ATPase, partial [bacterium]|nr:AAA family ATPase [bacterium]
RYARYLDPELRDELLQEIKEIKSAQEMLYGLADICRQSDQQLFIIIDEYDNFANTILSSSGHSAYKDLTHGEGFFRAFFNFLKEATTGSGASIARLFITGVSPVTLNGLTGGFNIGQNISFESEFNQLLGFTEADVKEMIQYYRDNGKMDFDTAEIMKFMSTWYNNYCFSKWADTRIYNTDMVLYFVNKCIRTGRFPDDPIDNNVRIDYGKLKHLIMIDSRDGARPNGNFNRLKQIIEQGEIRANEIVKSFTVDQLTATQNFISLLFYFGLLTIKGVEEGQLVLQIPNQTIKKLYYGYIESVYRETGAFLIDIYEYQQLMHGMAHKGEWKALLEFITQRLKESLSLRDLITGEKSIQAFLH